MASDRELRGERVETKGPKTEFEELGKERPLSLLQEFLVFILENKAWWLIPIVASLGLVGLLIALGSTGAAPFIYTLF
jgi:hypothetical protein